MFDVANHRLTVFTFDTSKSKIAIKKMLNLKHGFPYCPIFLNDTTIISLDYEISNGTRFSVFDSSGVFKKYSGKILSGKPKNVPANIHQRAAKGIIRVSPGGKKIIVSSTFSDIIDVFDAEGNLLNSFFGPLKQFPMYEVDVLSEGPIMRFADNAIKGYVDIEVTDNKIFALFSGKSLDSNYCNYIHVFN